MVGDDLGNQIMPRKYTSPAIEIARAALERGVLRRRINRKYPCGVWVFGRRTFSNATVKSLLRSGIAAKKNRHTIAKRVVR